jgi:predicted ribosome quality control (RQC) complex YloA/Tae2 family protein
VRIPFDSIVLSAVLNDLVPFLGGFVQDIRQPDENTVCLGIYKGGSQASAGQEAMLLLSCDPVFCRIHLITRRPGNLPQPLTFCTALRARLDGASLVDATQIASDRILVLRFDSPKGEHLLVAELMGKHSNLILLDHERRVVSAAKFVGTDKSSRPISPRAVYTWPPVISEPLLEVPTPRDPSAWFRFGAEQPERCSPFFRKLVESCQAPQKWQPVQVAGAGAYPVDLSCLGLPALPRSSISVALEQHFSTAVIEHRTEARRSGLIGSLNRVILARETAIADMGQTLQSDAKAAAWQRSGELILAYGASAAPGAASLEAWDYEGLAVALKLNPELDFKGNALAYFERAKRAKGRGSILAEQLSRLEADRLNLLAFLDRVTAAKRLLDVEDLWTEAKSRRWLTEQIHVKNKEDRPYEGHRIRELLAPGGFKVLYGENAESNDYLTLKVARPNDMWLHVRGSTSAHVVILTGNHPEKINKEQLLFAAKIAVQQSPSKHAGFVPVDYTLRRYVRRPRGAAKGTALYTHEKTLHIDS